MPTCTKCDKFYADKFKSCPNCSGKRGLIGLVAVVVIGAVVWMAWPSSSPTPTNSSNDAPAMQVSAIELAQAFQANEVAAQKRYGGQTLDVTGIITGVVLDFMNDPVIHLAGVNEFLAVQASFPKSAGDQLGQLSKGQQITVRCSSLTSVISAPMLSDCVLPPVATP